MRSARCQELPSCLPLVSVSTVHPAGAQPLAAGMGILHLPVLSAVSTAPAPRGQREFSASTLPVSLEIFLHLLHWEGKLILRDPLRLSVCERPHNLYHGRQQQSKRLIVQEGNIKHEASEVSVQRDSHTQWHRGESQHAAGD